MNADNKKESALIAEASKHNLYYRAVLNDKKTECEFISCQKEAILHIEEFDVCKLHGFRLIQCLTEKLNNDTVDENKE